ARARHGLGAGLGLSGPALPVPADAALDGGEDGVVVAREAAVHVALEQQPQHRVEGVVRLLEVAAGAAVAEALQPGVAGRRRPERLAYGVVPPGVAGLQLGQPLPRLPD